jgi:hypothetical protein
MLLSIILRGREEGEMFANNIVFEIRTSLNNPHITLTSAIFALSAMWGGGERMQV